MTITARFNGHGTFVDHDDASELPVEGVPSGGTFTTTKKRLKELADQGINVTAEPTTKVAPPTEEPKS